MKYIRQIHLDSPGTRSEHISRVNHSDTPTGPLSESSRTKIVQQITAGTETYQSRNSNGAQAPVVVRTSGLGTKYIATVSDGRETNNLLSLPKY
ncbi:DUF3892 domain-containing protein [Arthrobacter sp. CAL618]|uniref:DUF3892 domain-containing protein n=1 Tax=Arthrobacter sp. CAL618 TaxID=1055770 RepID=UPI0003F9576D|nr:DUF3892 domain-containing protein [Arthrobacter sp. CAL618]